MIVATTHQCPACEKRKTIEGPNSGQYPEWEWKTVSFDGSRYFVICGDCVEKIVKAVPYLRGLIEKEKHDAD